MDFDQWLADFTKDKKQVATLEQSDSFAVHSIRRYINDAPHPYTFGR